MKKPLLLLEEFCKYLLATILIVVPLYPKFPLIPIPGVFISIRLDDFLLGITFVVVSVIYFRRIREFLENKLYVSIILYLLVGVVSLFSAIFISQTVIPYVGFLHWARRVEYFTPLFLASYLLKKKPTLLDFYIKLLLLVVVFAFIYGWGQRFLSWPIIITQNEEYSKGIALRWIPGSHINSTFAGHYDLATFLVLVLPIVIALFGVISKKTQRAFLFSVFMAGLWLLVHSASRISLLSYLVSSILALILIKKHRLIPFVILVSLAFTFLSPNLVARYKRLYEVTLQKVKSVKLESYRIYGIIYASEQYPIPEKEPSITPTPTPVFEDRSSNIRLRVEWPRAMRAFAKNPLFGTGYSSITLATDNDFLRLLGETGILGFLAFFLILVRVAVLLIKVFPITDLEPAVERAFFAGFISSFPGLMVNAFFIDIFEASKFAIIFWTLIGIALGIVSSKKNKI